MVDKELVDEKKGMSIKSKQRRTEEISESLSVSLLSFRRARIATI